jgi:hypothetical protein
MNTRQVKHHKRGVAYRCTMPQSKVLQHTSTGQARLQFAQQIHQLMIQMQPHYKTNKSRLRAVDAAVEKSAISVRKQQHNIDMERQQCLKAYNRLQQMYAAPSNDPQIARQLPAATHECYKRFESFDSHLHTARQFALDHTRRNMPDKLNEIEQIERERQSFVCDSLHRFSELYQSLCAAVQESSVLLSEVISTIQRNKILNTMFDQYENSYGNNSLTGANQEAAHEAALKMDWGLPCTPQEFMEQFNVNNGKPVRAGTDRSSSGAARNANSSSAASGLRSPGLTAGDMRQAAISSSSNSQSRNMNAMNSSLDLQSNSLQQFASSNRLSAAATAALAGDNAELQAGFCLIVVNFDVR